MEYLVVYSPCDESSSLLDKLHSRIAFFVVFISRFVPFICIGGGGFSWFKGDRISCLHFSVVEIGKQRSSYCHRSFLSDRALTDWRCLSAWWKILSLNFRYFQSCRQPKLSSFQIFFCRQKSRISGLYDDYFPDPAFRP